MYELTATEAEQLVLTIRARRELVTEHVKRARSVSLNTKEGVNALKLDKLVTRVTKKIATLDKSIEDIEGMVASIRVLLIQMGEGT